MDDSSVKANVRIIKFRTVINDKKTNAIFLILFLNGINTTYFTTDFRNPKLHKL